MIPGHVNEDTIIRPPLEVNEVNRVLRLLTIKLDLLMEQRNALPSAERQEEITAKYAKAAWRRQLLKEGKAP